MSLKKQAFFGVIWTFIEMFGGQFINFFVNIYLARLLSPDDYGLLGMIFIFITISATLMDSGLTSSIMRTKNPTEEDYATLFSSNICFSVLFYGVLFFVAPFIGDFYDNEAVAGLIRIYGLSIIFQAFVQIQSVYLIKNLKFKKQTLMKLPSIMLSSCVGIYLAYNGYGVWSLIFMYLLQSFFWALFHWLFGEWNPKIYFGKEIFKKHFGYGYRMTLVELMNNITANIYQIVIGKFYSISLVGYYTQSLTLRQLPMTNIYGAMVKVLFPIFADIQHDRKRLTTQFYLCQKLLMLFLFPIFAFLIFNAEQILVVLFSEKWRGATIYLRVLGIAGMFSVLSNWSLAIIKIVSEPRRVLRIEATLKLLLISLIAFALTAMDNINYLLMTIPLYALVACVIYNVVLSRLLNTNVWRGLKEGLPFLLMAVAPLSAYYITARWIGEDNSVLLLLLHIFCYFSLYTLIVYIFKRSLLKYLLTAVTVKGAN